MSTFLRSRWPTDILFFEDIITDDIELQKHIIRLREEVTVAYPKVEAVQEIVADFEPNVVVDLGANFGIFSITQGTEYKEIHAFEPSTVLSEFCKMTARMGWAGSTIGHKLFVHRLAASDTTGDIVRLYGHPFDDPGDNSIKIENEGKKMPSETCMTISLPDIFKLIGHDFIDYMKVDIEGAEYPFLMRQDLSQIGVMVLEKHECLWEGHSQRLLIDHISNYMHTWRTPLQHEDNIWLCVNKNYKFQGIPSYGVAPDFEPQAQERYIGEGKWE